MTEPLTFPSEELPPIADLEALAIVTQDDIDQVKEKWEQNPPVDEFKLILEAEDKE